MYSHVMLYPSGGSDLSTLMYVSTYMMCFRRWMAHNTLRETWTLSAHRSHDRASHPPVSAYVAPNRGMSHIPSYPHIITQTLDQALI